MLIKNIRKGESVNVSEVINDKERKHIRQSLSIYYLFLLYFCNFVKNLDVV